jgi:competence protein ComEC
VRVVAAIPATALLAGSAAGLLVPEIAGAPGLTCLIVMAVAAGWARRAANAAIFAATVAAGFALGGALLSADAWREAWRPTLRLAFEELARQERLDAERERYRLPLDDQAFATVTGVLRADAAPTPTGVSLSIDVDSIAAVRRTDPSSPASRSMHVSGGILVTVVGSLAAGQLGQWRAGRRIRMPVQLRRPSRYLDPGVPDDERALARRGATLVGTVKSGALVDVVATGGPIDEVAGAVRAYARRVIAQAVGTRSARSAGIVAAIVIGDRAGLDAELERRLQEAGTYHVIAISGGNIAILAGLILLGFRSAAALGPCAMLSTVVVLVGYARLVGGGASVDRATLMAVTYLIARAVDHRSEPLNTLAVVVGCLVATQPLSITDPGFVLTVGATLAILLASPAMRALRLPRLAKPVAALLIASIAVEIALLPVGARLFSRVTFAGLGLNFVAIPLMTIAQMAGLVLVGLALVSPGAASAVGYVAHLAADGLVRSADLAQLVPSLVVRMAPPSSPFLTGYYVGVAVAILRWRRTRWRRTALAVVVFTGVWMVGEPWALVAERGDGRLHVTVVDVGQGECVFVRLPRGLAILVDAGGLSSRSAFDIGDRVVAPVLRAAGVRRIDIFALTHGDPDHIGGAPSVFREFRPRTVWEGIPVPPFEPLRVLRATARNVGATWLIRTAGERIRLDEVDVIVHHPEAPDWERQRVRNDDSLVLELRWRDVSMVLTGDIGKVVEQRLARDIAPAPIRILKVPHHGSLTSSTPEFVRALAPAIAVVSVGRANRFGHPAPEVLRRYREAGAEVFRTDRDGAVTIDTDGTTVDVRTFAGQRLLLSGSR